MSEHGTFITEDLTCQKCYDGFANAIEDCSDILKRWIGRNTGVAICGFVTTSAINCESHVLEFELRDRIEAAICHPVSLVVLPQQYSCGPLEDGDGAPTVVHYTPKGDAR